MSLPAGSWGYPSFRERLAGRFPGLAIRKLSLHAGFTCPNLDGTLSRGGCSYCNNRGFVPAAASSRADLRRQWDAGRARLRQRYGKTDGFIAYFQAYSNTYAPPERLREIYDPVPLAYPECLGASLGTRPDCLQDGVLDELERLARRTFLTVEIGLQSDRDEVLHALRRGHSRAQFLDAVDRAAGRGFEMCVHLILGLPGEGPDAPERMGDLMAALPVQSVKLHNLHIMKGTAMAEPFRRGLLRPPSRREYLSAAARFIRRLRPDQFLQRVVADAPEGVLLSDPWCHGKQDFLADLRRELAAPEGVPAAREAHVGIPVLWT